MEGPAATPEQNGSAGFSPGLGPVVVVVGGLLILLSPLVTWATWSAPAGGQPGQSVSLHEIAMSELQSNRLPDILILAGMAAVAVAIAFRFVPRIRAMAGAIALISGIVGLLDASVLRNYVAKDMGDFPPEGGFGHVSWGPALAIGGAVLVVIGAALMIAGGRSDRAIRSSL